MAQLQSLADAPNTLREYETIYILNPDTLNDKVAEVNERVKAIIEDRGGQILAVDNWGKRKLAYEIKKERKGIYLFWQYLGSPDIVAEFERNMRMIDPVMRYMTVKLENNVASGSRESSVDGETFEKAASTAADEEEIMMKRSPGDSDEDNEDADDQDDSDDSYGDDDADDDSDDDSNEADDDGPDTTEEEN